MNSAMLSQLISDNQLLTVFQNANRLRSGKLSRQTQPDMSIRWILHAYQALTGVADKIVIVPVMISYDRIFEHANLSSEMISGEKLDYNLVTAMWNIFRRKENQMGDVYVKYLKPINVH